jgi:putative transposase
VLREQEAEMKVAEVCRKHDISEPTFDAGKAKFGGMSVSDAKRLKQLEAENAKLNKLLAEATLDVAVLKDITSGNVWSAPPSQGFRSDERRQFALTYPASREWVAVATRP